MRMLSVRQCSRTAGDRRPTAVVLRRTAPNVRRTGRTDRPAGENEVSVVVPTLNSASALLVVRVRRALRGMRENSIVRSGCVARRCWLQAIDLELYLSDQLVPTTIAAWRDSASSADYGSARRGVAVVALIS